MSKKRKSFHYRDWKYKIRLNKRTINPMTKHMNYNRLTYKSLASLGVFDLLPIRIASTYELKRRFRFKKNMDW